MPFGIESLMSITSLDPLLLLPPAGIIDLAQPHTPCLTSFDPVDILWNHEVPAQGKRQVE